VFVCSRYQIDRAGVAVECVSFQCLSVEYVSVERVFLELMSGRRVNDVGRLKKVGREKK
jgi:hypothetical protein